MGLTSNQTLYSNSYRNKTLIFKFRFCTNKEIVYCISAPWIIVHQHLCILDSCISVSQILGSCISVSVCILDSCKSVSLYPVRWFNDLFPLPVNNKLIYS